MNTILEANRSNNNYIYDPFIGHFRFELLLLLFSHARLSETPWTVA